MSLPPPAHVSTDPGHSCKVKWRSVRLGKPVILFGMQASGPLDCYDAHGPLDCYNAHGVGLPLQLVVRNVFTFLSVTQQLLQGRKMGDGPLVVGDNWHMKLYDTVDILPPAVCWLQLSVSCSDVRMHIKLTVFDPTTTP